MHETQLRRCICSAEPSRALNFRTFTLDFTIPVANLDAFEIQSFKEGITTARAAAGTLVSVSLVPRCSLPALPPYRSTVMISVQLT